MIDADNTPTLTVSGAHGESGHCTLVGGSDESSSSSARTGSSRSCLGISMKTGRVPLDWHTLDQGLYLLQKQSIRTYTKGLIDRDAYAIYQDRSGAVWIGAWHSGFSRFADGRFTSYSMADGLPNELVTALFEDREGTSGPLPTGARHPWPWTLP